MKNWVRQKSRLWEVLVQVGAARCYRSNDCGVTVSLMHLCLNAEAESCNLRSTWDWNQSSGCYQNDRFSFSSTVVTCQRKLGTPRRLRSRPHPNFLQQSKAFRKLDYLKECIGLTIPAKRLKKIHNKNLSCQWSGRRISQISDDAHESAFLFQRLSVSHSVAVQDTFTHASTGDEF